MSYAEGKARAREEAIKWQACFNELELDWNSIALFGAYFKKLGKKYGLVKEFRENGII